MNHTKTLLIALISTTMLVHCIDDDPRHVGSGSYAVTLCDDTGECSDGESCREGLCLDDCMSDSDCPDDAICIDGSCWGGAGGERCAATEDCADGEACIDGLCAELAPVIDCASDDDCPPDALCADGECVHDATCDIEICDGLDNDCDGEIDEECSVECDDGETRSCGDDIGACTPGAMTCVDGHWSTCVGAVEPAAEICDGIDNDCDGEVDEECGGDDMDGDGFPLPEDCNDSDPSINPGVSELCDDDIDNDCDGEVDEGCGGECDDGETRSCGDDTGACTPGAMTCVDGHWSTCVGAVDPAPEICDGIDNDCDGEIDEECGGDDMDGDGFPLPEDCNDSDPTVHPGALESCDAMDNDCDGEIDEGCGCGPELCDDGIDNDCDGVIDEGCGGDECDDGATMMCGFDMGACSAGTMTCIDGLWSTCAGAVEPAPEICDGIDNDCDGEVDEECGGGDDVDGDGFPLPEDCNDGDPAVHPGAPELCDAMDNDCDGEVDEACL